jgi:hypothetical protein
VLVLAALSLIARLFRTRREVPEAALLLRANGWALAVVVLATAPIVSLSGGGAAVLYARTLATALVVVHVVDWWLATRDRRGDLAGRMVLAAWLSAMAIPMCWVNGDWLADVAVALLTVATVFLVTGVVLGARGAWTATLAVLLFLPTLFHWRLVFLFGS